MNQNRLIKNNKIKQINFGNKSQIQIINLKQNIKKINKIDLEPQTNN